MRFLYRGQFQLFRLAGFREHFRDLHAAGQQFHHHPADKDLGKRDHKGDRNRDRRPRRVALAWDVEGTPFTIKSVEQSEQTDCEFYMNLCNTYGLAMKVYAQKIVVYDREAYKKKGAAAGAVPVQYEILVMAAGSGRHLHRRRVHIHQPGHGKGNQGDRGQGRRILKQSGKADSKADAERKIKAAVAKANHGQDKTFRHHCGKRLSGGLPMCPGGGPGEAVRQVLH